MRFHNAYMLGLLRRSTTSFKNAKVVPINSSASEARINQRTGTREAPQRWKVVHDTSKKETADSRWFKEMKEKYGSNIKDWPTMDKIKEVVIDPETSTQTTFALPKDFKFKVQK